MHAPTTTTMSTTVSTPHTPFTDNHSPFNPFRSRRPRSASPPTVPNTPNTLAPLPLSEETTSVTESTTSPTPAYAPPPGPPPPRQPAPTPARVPSPPPLPSRTRSRSLSPPPSFRFPSPPPSYTASANSWAGEQTVELGPRRPFQPAPPPILTPNISPHHTGWNPPPNRTGGLTPNRTGASGWSAYPGQLSRHPTGMGGPPPLPPRQSTMHLTPQTTGILQSGTPQPSGSNVPNDGTPTSNPTPGHPLLLSGRVLVYPLGYECYKCHNVGYKNNDPTHPCQKCWKKYSKVYAGPLLYASWLNPTPDTNFQRPLPSLSAFQPSAMMGYSSIPPRVPLPTRPPMPLGGSSIGFGSSRPPPGSLVVRPGDPRIGGRLCWNCGGDGVVSMFFFDTERCRVCKGMGRVLT